MSLFRKTAPAVTPVATHMTPEWFNSYFDSILSESGVAADDGQNRVQVTWFALDRVLDDVAFKAFEMYKDPGSRRQYDQLVDSGAGPSERVAFLVGWNSELLGVLGTRLEDNKALMLKAGQMHGRFRFVSSKCHGQPVEFSLQDGSTYCSECRRPA